MFANFITCLGFVSTITSQATGSLFFDTSFDGFGKCAIPAYSYANWASVGPSVFQDSLICGQCIEINNTETGVSTIAHVVDQCLSCDAEDLNLSVSAFRSLGEISKGILYGSWSPIRCPDIKGNLQYSWLKGSNKWWGSFQILNHAEGVESVEVGPCADGPFTELERSDDNRFVTNQTGPFSIKVTSISGKTVVDSDLHPLKAGGIVVSSGQF